jgi:quercetin dioxygenase-like cupin family protein
VNVSAETDHYRDGWTSGDSTRRFIPFNVNDLKWSQVKLSADGHEFSGRPESLDAVDFEKYFAHGMWNAFIDAGSFNILGVKLAPEFTIPRHHHNIDQLVMVHEGEVWLGSRRYVPGDAYFTRAGHTYSITAGPEGAIVLEIRHRPITELTLIWDESDPTRWVHGRRPKSPASTDADN